MDSHSMIKKVNITSINKIHYTGQVCNIEVESNTTKIELDDKYFIDDSTGLVNHNCFPKDVNGLMAYAKSLHISVPILKSIWKRNLTIDRPEKDWEELKGRSVSI